MLTKKSKSDVIKKFAKSDKDTGSCEVQIGLLTRRIEHVAAHLKKFGKDKHSQAGLIKLVDRRRSFLEYLRKNDKSQFNKIVGFMKKKQYVGDAKDVG